METRLAEALEERNEIATRLMISTLVGQEVRLALQEAQGPGTDESPGEARADNEDHRKLAITAPSRALSPGTVATLTGTHTLSLASYVWVILSDSYGNYYLQSPPVQLNRDGSWTATNIRVGRGIVGLHIVLASTEADSQFQQQVLDGDWSGFPRLPNGAEILTSLGPW